MSGNAARLGVALGQGHLGAALPFVVAGGAFVGGIALGTVTVELLPDRRTTVLVLEAILLVAFMVYGGVVVDEGGSVPDHALAPYYVLVVIVVGAMGFQTSALSRVGGQTVRTTYISGVVTNMTQAAIGAWRARRRAGPSSDAQGRRARLLAEILFAYLAGAFAGSWGHARVGIWVLGVPLLALAAAAASLGVGGQSAECVDTRASAQREREGAA